MKKMPARHLPKIQLIIALLFISTFVDAQSIHLDSFLMSRMIQDSSFEIIPGITETNLYYLNTSGNPEAVYILKIKLKKHHLGLEAATPFNKDTFCRQTVTDQMQWENTPGHQVITGVNADFFNMKNGVPEEMEWKEGKMLKDGFMPHRSFMGVLKNGKVLIGDSLLYVRKKKHLKEALGGNQLLVKNGKVIPQLPNSFSLTRHPRTAAGIINKHTILFVVIDGRHPKYSNGMPLDELAHLMQILGAKTAINLDGGGSSTLVSLDAKTRKWMLRNKPSGGRERTIANAWIVVKY